MTHVDDIEVLVATEAIRRVKASYFRLLDTKQWDDLAELFTPDATIDVRDDSGVVIEGAAAFVDALRSVLADVETVHQGGMSEIDVTSPSTAVGVWAMQDHLRWPATADGIRELHGYGHYHETYVRDGRIDGEGGRWRISSMRLTRLRRDVTST